MLHKLSFDRATREMRGMWVGRCRFPIVHINVEGHFKSEAVSTANPLEIEKYHLLSKEFVQSLILNIRQNGQPCTHG